MGGRRASGAHKAARVWRARDDHRARTAGNPAPCEPDRSASPCPRRAGRGTTSVPRHPDPGERRRGGSRCTAARGREHDIPARPAGEGAGSSTVGRDPGRGRQQVLVAAAARHCPAVADCARRHPRYPRVTRMPSGTSPTRHCCPWASCGKTRPPAQIVRPGTRLLPGPGRRSQRGWRRDCARSGRPNSAMHRYVHKVNEHAVVRPYTAFLSLGSLTGPGTIAGDRAEPPPRRRAADPLRRARGNAALTTSQLPGGRQSMTVDRDDFAKFFAAVNGGHRPFSWQERLLDTVLGNGRWPDQIAAPTGAGKTSAIDVHVFATALTVRDRRPAAAAPPGHGGRPADAGRRPVPAGPRTCRETRVVPA